MQNSDTEWEENSQQVDQKPPKITLFNFFKKVTKEKKCQRKIERNQSDLESSESKKEAEPENDQHLEPGKANAYPIEVVHRKKYVTKNQKCKPGLDNVIRNDGPTFGIPRCCDKVKNNNTFSLTGENCTSDKVSICHKTYTKPTSQTVVNEVKKCKDEFNPCPETKLLPKSCKEGKKGRAEGRQAAKSVDQAADKEISIANPDSQPVLSEYDNKPPGIQILDLVSVNEMDLMTSIKCEMKIIEEECVVSKTICKTSEDQNGSADLKSPDEAIVMESYTIFSTDLKMHNPEDKGDELVQKRNTINLPQEQVIRSYEDKASTHLSILASSWECGGSGNKRDAGVNNLGLKKVEEFDEHNVITHNSNDSKKFSSLFTRESVLKQGFAVFSDQPTPIPRHSHVMQLTATETDWLNTLKKPNNVKMQPYHSSCISFNVSSKVKEFHELLHGYHLGTSDSQIVLWTGYTTIEGASRKDDSLLSLIARYKKSSMKVIQDCLDRYIKAQKVIQATWRKHMASSSVTADSTGSKEGTGKSLLGARKHSAIKEALKVAVRKQRSRPRKASRSSKQSISDDEVKLIEMKPTQTHVVKKGSKRVNQQKRKNELAKYFNARIKQVKTGKIGNVTLKQLTRRRTMAKKIIQDEEENYLKNTKNAPKDFLKNANRLTRSTVDVTEDECPPSIDVEEDDSKRTQNLKTKKFRRNRRVVIADDTNVETDLQVQKSRGNDIRSLFNHRPGEGANKFEEDDLFINSTARKRSSRRKRGSVRCLECAVSDRLEAKRMKCELRVSGEISENYNDRKENIISKGRRKRGQKEQSSQDSVCRVSTEVSRNKDESKGRDIRVMFSAVSTYAMDDDCSTIKKEDQEKLSSSPGTETFPITLDQANDLGKHQNGKKMSVQKIVPKVEEAPLGSILQAEEIQQPIPDGSESGILPTLSIQEARTEDSVPSTAAKETHKEDNDDAGDKKTNGLTLSTCSNLSSSIQVEQCLISSVANDPRPDDGFVVSSPCFAINGEDESSREKEEKNKLKSDDQVLSSFNFLGSDDLRLDRNNEEDILPVLATLLRRSSRLKDKEIVELNSSVNHYNTPESLNSDKKRSKRRRKYESEVLEEADKADVLQSSLQDANQDQGHDKVDLAPNTFTVEPTPLNAETVNYSMTWAEKYTPLSSSMTLQSCSSGIILFQWLKEWKDRHEKYVSKLNQWKTRKVKKCFIDSDSESTSDDEESIVNTMVLVGPVGNGSTTSVYACAYELGYKVLELNPSSCRSGKIVMGQLGEATQSHQVRRQGDGRIKHGSLAETQTSPAATKDFFNNRTQGNSQEDAAATGEPTESEKTSTKAMSVILFEQADIVFNEQDKGFWQAVTELRNEARRPIIFTLNDVTVLKNFQGSEPLVLKPKRPSLQALYNHLQAICLLEKVYINPASLKGLIIRCDRDFRKTLLQLEFWVEQWKFSNDTGLDVAHENPTCQDGDVVLPNCLDVNLGNNADDVESAFHEENTGQIDVKSLNNSDSIKADEVPSIESHDDSVARDSQDQTVCDSEAERISCITLNVTDERSGLDFMARNKIDPEVLTSFLISRNPEYYSLLKRRCNNVVKDEQLLLVSSFLDARSEVDKASVFGHQRECFGWWKSEILPGNVDELPTTEPPTASSELDSVLMYSRGVLDDVFRMYNEERPTSFSLLVQDDTRWQHLLHIQEKMPLQRSISHREFVLDCMPALSIMSHSEQVRQATQVKRSRRFLHYFDSISLHLDDDVKSYLANCDLPWECPCLSTSFCQVCR